MMRRLLVVIFAFVLLANPLTAHHAVGEALHENGDIASHGAQVASDQCEMKMDCEKQSNIMCCSQAVTHCSPTFSHNDVWAEISLKHTVSVFFSKYHEPLAELMFEAETPPPRV